MKQLLPYSKAKIAAILATGIQVCSANATSVSQSLNYEDHNNDSSSFISAIQQSTVITSSYIEGDINISCIKNGTQPGLYSGNGKWDKYPEISTAFNGQLKISPINKTDKCSDGSMAVIIPSVAQLENSGGLNAYNKKSDHTKKIIPNKIMPRSITGDTFNHEWAVASMNGNFIGAATFLDVWRPTVPVEQSSQSISQFWALGENSTTQQGIEVGWHVLPQVYNGSRDPHFFVYIRTSSTAGCLNTACGDKYIQAQGALPPGSPLPFSVANGGKVEYYIGVSRDSTNGDWHIILINSTGTAANDLGVVPSRVFSGGPMEKSMTRFDIGGEISHKAGVDITAMQMGSGAAFNTNSATSARHRNIVIQNTAGTILPFTGTVVPPSSPNCYNAQINNNSQFGSHLFFGGNGGLASATISCVSK